jgi:hypothetical protein
MPMCREKPGAVFKRECRGMRSDVRENLLNFIRKGVMLEESQSKVDVDEGVKGGVGISDGQISHALRSLPRRLPPASLRSSLRVMASREKQRREYGRTAIAMDRLHMFADNLMRPLALPFAGGVFSTVILFSMWLGPMYSVRASTSSDVPTILTTEATVKVTAPIASAGDATVDVTVDGEGRMIGYTVLSGDVDQDEALRRSIESVLLMTRFTPATAFGQPVSGRIRLSLHSSHIDVKG